VIQVQYTVEERDYETFQWFHFKRSPTVRRSNVVSFLLIIAGVWMLVGLQTTDVAIRAVMTLGIGVVVCALMYSLMTGLIAAAIKSSLPSGAQNGILGDHSLSLDESGMRETTPVSETKYTWRGIEQLVRARAHVFVYTSPTAALIIPNRAFHNEQAIDDFCGYIEGHVASNGA
jgi:hypothetical protein